MVEVVVIVVANGGSDGGDINSVCGRKNIIG